MKLQFCLNTMRIFVSYPHPDDESFGPAAMLAKYARRGAEIRGLFFTRGEQGDSHIRPRPSPEELGGLREQDLRDASRVIGFQSIEVLGYRDGGVADVPEAELETHVDRLMRAFLPDVVVTFGPAGITRHPDHIAIHRATFAVFHRLRREGLSLRELYYDAMPPERAVERGMQQEPDGQANTLIDISETLEVKIEALRIHARHIADAREAVARLEREPRTEALLHRAWPAVQPGIVVRELLSETNDYKAPERRVAPGE
jgi:N-acetylglucosamine malate deacetylase 2